MKALYFVYFHPERKTGLFYSTHERIKYSIPFLENYQILNFRYYDNWLLSLLKLFIGLKPTKKGDRFHNYDNLIYENVWICRGVFSSVTTWGKLDKIRVFKFLMNEYFISNKFINSITNQAEDFDYIMAHWGYPNGRYAEIVSLKNNKPYFVTFHGSDLNVQPRINHIFKNRIISIIKNSRSNIVVSDALCQIVKNFLPSSRIFVSKNGIPSNLIIYSKENPKNYNDCIKIIFIGNLVIDKRADKLGEIIKLIEFKSKINLKFYILGDGPYKSSIYNELNSANLNFEMLGLIPREDVYKFLSEANILILPSRNEGMPLVILEALATKTIPIASAVGGIPEILPIDFLVQQSSQFEEDFSNKVVSILKNSKYPDINISSFTWEYLMNNEYEFIKKQLT